MKIYTSEEIYKALRNNVSIEISDKQLMDIINISTVNAYLNNKTHDFKEIMRAVYDFYNDPNFKELEEQLDRIYECDVPSLEFEHEEFSI